MFQRFSDFIEYLESLPPIEMTFQQREELLVEARAWVRAHHLIPTVPIVTVTGTNGKGSTVKALAEILVQHGLKLHTFTSPHLSSYTERFSSNLEFIDEKTLLRLANELATMMDLSRWNFFFILFFIHLLLCQESPSDCILLEVGIGGRLDPTNILDASIVILTQVALDHTHILGDTREEIGLEKAGLLREGIPFICGDPNPPVTVIEKAAELHCPFYQINRDFGFKVQTEEWDLWLGDSVFAHLPPPKIHLISLSCAFQAAKLLFPAMQFKPQFMQTKLPQIYLPGRYQQLNYAGHEFVIDVSHNPAAVAALAKFLQLLPNKRQCAIFGIKATKDVSEVISLMKNEIDDWYLVSVGGIGGMEAAALVQFFKPFGITPKIAASVADAIQKITEQESTDTRVVAFGSFHVAGPALDFIYSSTAA